MAGGETAHNSTGVLAGDSSDLNLNLVNPTPHTRIAKSKAMRRGMMGKVAGVVCYDDLAMTMEEPAWSILAAANAKALPNWVSNMKPLDDTQRVTPVTLYDKANKRTMSVCIVFRVEWGELTWLGQGKLTFTSYLSSFQGMHSQPVLSYLPPIAHRHRELTADSMGDSRQGLAKLVQEYQKEVMFHQTRPYYASLPTCRPSTLDTRSQTPARASNMSCAATRLQHTSPSEWTRTPRVGRAW